MGTRDILFSCNDFETVRFDLKKGCNIPLHGHPSQTGFLYIIQGTCEVTTYNVVGYHLEDQPILEKSGHASLNANDYAHFSPEQNNFHELVFTQDTIMLDVFAKDPKGCCHSCWYQTEEITGKPGTFIAIPISCDEVTLPFELP